MSIDKVRDCFRPLGRERDILEFPVSSATVGLEKGNSRISCSRTRGLKYSRNLSMDVV